MADKYEIQLQAECFQWAWNTYPETRRCLFHVPNGGSRNKAEAMQLKASGVVAGIPDLLFVWKGVLYAFEAKTLTGSLSPVQKEVHASWQVQGISVVVFRTVEQFQNTFNQILCRTR